MKRLTWTELDKLKLRWSDIEALYITWEELSQEVFPMRNYMQ